MWYLVTVDILQHPTTTLLATAISLIGQEPFPPAVWALLQDLVRPDNLAILAFRDHGPPLALYRQAQAPAVFAELERTYLAGAYRLDPYFELHLARAPDGAYALRDIAPDAFHRSRYFDAYYHQTALIDEIAFLVRMVPGVSLHLSLGRDATTGRRFSAAEVDICQRFGPVVGALVRAHWQGIGGSAGPAEDAAKMLAQAARRVGIRLSPRQADVALLILRGHSTVSIALRLGVSPQTVKVFRKQLYGRCGISSQAELFAQLLPLLNDASQSSSDTPSTLSFGRASVGIEPVAR